MIALLSNDRTAVNLQMLSVVLLRSAPQFLWHTNKTSEAPTPVAVSCCVCGARNLLDSITLSGCQWACILKKLESKIVRSQEIRSTKFRRVQNECPECPKKSLLRFPAHQRR